MNKPLVSIVVPVYNGERYLAAALHSILAQDYRPFEIIVVDDGSTDGSASIVRSLAQVHNEIRYLHQDNQGLAAALNRGIAAGRGELFAFLDADDLWVSDKLHIQVNHLLQHPHLGYTLTRMRWFLEPGIDPPSWSRWRPDLLSEDLPGYGLGTMLIRRSIFEQIGTFDPQYQASDSDWFARAKDASVPMTVLHETLLRRRIHDANISHRHGLLRSDLLSILRTSINRKGSQAQRAGSRHHRER
jgi:glycosyltransferase involved in cell wall biosynthesis